MNVRTYISYDVFSKRYIFKNPVTGQVEKFKRLHDFRDGWAAIQLENDRWTFIHENGERWHPSYLNVTDFVDGVAAVKVDEDKWMFIDKNRRLLTKQAFKNVNNQSGGVALVQLKNGSWSYLDKKTGELWKQRFKEASTFSSAGLACVRLKLGGYTFVDRKGKLWKQRFSSATSFNHGIASVKLGRKKTYVNAFGDECPEEYVDELEEIFDDPKKFLDLPTERFLDKEFIKLAVAQVKASLADPTPIKFDSSRTYAIEHAKELLIQIKDKIRIETAEAQRLRYLQKKRNEEFSGFIDGSFGL